MKLVKYEYISRHKIFYFVSRTCTNAVVTDLGRGDAIDVNGSKPIGVSTLGRPMSITRCHLADYDDRKFSKRD